MSGALSLLIGAGQSYSIDVVPPSAQGVGIGDTVYTNEVNVVVSPSGSYQYAWARDSEPDGIMISPSPGQTASWLGTRMSLPETRTESWKCTVSLGGSVIGEVFVPVSVIRA